MAAQHHILRQHLVLAASGIAPLAANTWHERLDLLQASTILPALERQLAAVDPGREEVVIERLEITVEAPGLDQLEATLEAQIAPLLAKALRQAMPELNGPRTAAVPFIQHLVHYLQTGNLGPSFSDAAAFQAALAAWYAVADRGDWELLFELAVAAPERIFGRIAQVPGQSLWAQGWATLRKLYPHQVGQHPAPALPHQAPPHGDLNLWVATLKAAGYGNKRAALTNQPSPSKSLPQLAQASGSSPGAPTTWYPENAGIVLLHAYLPYLLKETNLLDDDGLPRYGPAAALLHYCAFGQPNGQEWDYPLTKVLLGLTPDDYLPGPGAPLSAEPLAFADAFLEGVIENWGALGQASPAALRDAFLQRPGLLRRQGRTWHLTVDRKPYDVLLDRLPWGISMVKAPWMPDLLQVAWS
ncbi:contractile injection system tape measure protein [Neolewinella lacunae]|uniref:Uncharacterized protein n=1 Tax=Neolewinella lacunae TaxID=1517758 RepID=A0A923PFS3_9BACT|nr:contractile injection system tape measure protein [Neolewinella lacunae]MBC6993257.1 hypothetical protein [Neolewinella lacunae]MDN3635696.1 contractile injection system tape measure protein [Neolewinella lacunae]